VSGYRLTASAGVWLDRERPAAFTFNGRDLQGFAGDTLASALLANGIVHTGLSFKLHRPRGIFSCGVEEPTGLLDVVEGAARTPNTRAIDIELSAGLTPATGNAWPSLGFAVGGINAKFAALLPPGFYYKTLMWPQWHWFEPTIRRAAGLGHAAPADSSADPARHDQVSRAVDTLVIGGGAAGLQAAIAAAQAGREVLLMEGAPRLGGWIAADTGRVAAVRARLEGLGGNVLTRCTVFGLYDHALAAAVQTIDGAVRERVRKVRARRIVIAAGAFERPILFPDNDRPGVMLAGPVQRYAALYGVACGRRVVIAAACDSAYRIAQALVDAGVGVAANFEQRAAANARAPAGVPVHAGHAIVALRGTRAVQGVRIASQDGAHRLDIDADCVASAGGWTPAANLYSMAGGSLRWDDAASMFVPAKALPDIELVGAGAGAFDFDAALEHAQRIGGGASEVAPVGGVGHVPADNQPSAAALDRQPGKILVDLQNDVSASDVALAARELTLGRAPQALHHDGHGHRPGQDEQRQRAGADGWAHAAHAAAGRNHQVPPAVQA
jgi:sarcosine oxidase, subunit alpha